MKVYLVWPPCFLSAAGENYPWKRGDKSRLEKNWFWFFVWIWFRKDYKDDPGRDFYWHNIVHPLSGVDSFGWNFFIRFFSGKWFTRDYEDDLCRNFCCHNIFPPLFGGWNLGVKLIYSIVFCENGKIRCPKTILEGVLASWPNISFAPFRGLTVGGKYFIFVEIVQSGFKCRLNTQK